MSLDFLVIGAQTAGTTTLWQLLRDHPQLWLPETKEAPFFSHADVYARGWERYLDSLDIPARPGLLRGTVTPHYMHGWQDTDTRTIAWRIARQLPDVRLVAILREPVERARSAHAMARARGREQRDADVALAQSLSPAELSRARRSPEDSSSYVTAGEYGRILDDYLGSFARTAVHIELTPDLAREPLAVTRRILGFLGVADDYKPPAPFQRAFAGGHDPRVADADVVALLKAIDAAAGDDAAAVASHWLASHSIDAAGQRELQDSVLRYLQGSAPQRARRRAGLEFTLRKIWNVAPAPPEPISSATQALLHAHFAQDARRLQALTGLAVPWAREFAASSH